MKKRASTFNGHLTAPQTSPPQRCPGGFGAGNMVLDFKHLSLSSLVSSLSLSLSSLSLSLLSLLNFKCVVVEWIFCSSACRSHSVSSPLFFLPCKDPSSPSHTTGVDHCPTNRPLDAIIRIGRLQRSRCHDWSVITTNTHASKKTNHGRGNGMILSCLQCASTFS